MAKFYRVKLRWDSYRFADRDAAIDFAEAAFDSSEESSGVTIELVREEEESNE